MSLPHALLTSLLEKPCSGLDLAKRFDKSFGYFWPASHQIIYKELAKLEEAGLVSSKADEGSRGRKREYKVLAAGKKELRHWVKQVDDPTPMRDALMVRLRAEAVLGGGAGVINDLLHRKAQHEKQLKLYQDIEQRDFAKKELSIAQHLQYLVLQAGLATEAAQAEFCTKAIEVLNHFNKPSA